MPQVKNAFSSIYFTRAFSPLKQGDYSKVITMNFNSKTPKLESRAKYTSLTPYWYWHWRYGRLTAPFLSVLPGASHIIGGYGGVATWLPWCWQFTEQSAAGDTRGNPLCPGSGFSWACILCFGFTACRWPKSPCFHLSRVTTLFISLMALAF
jgi:hypothetical protein